MTGILLRLLIHALPEFRRVFRNALSAADLVVFLIIDDGLFHFFLFALHFALASEQKKAQANNCDATHEKKSPGHCGGLYRKWFAGRCVPDEFFFSLSQLCNGDGRYGIAPT